MNNKSSLDLKTAIISAIAYFDIFDYPLTSIEVWKWLYSPMANGKLQIVMEGLENLISKKLIESQRGFYFLSGRKNIVAKRLERYNIAEIKFKKAIKIGKILALIPFIKMIAVCNTLGYSNARRQSDIDFSIIAAKKRIWLTRFLAVFFLKIFGLRPKGENSQDKFCLSFFITEDNLNLQELTLDQNDIHFQYWLMQFVPIYDKDGIYQEFMLANKWLRDYLPNNFKYLTNYRRRIKDRFRLVKSIFAALTTNLDERFYRWLQLKIMPQQLKEMANKDTRVMVTDSILKFHDNDKREVYRDLWQRKVTSLIQ